MTSRDHAPAPVASSCPRRPGILFAGAIVLAGCPSVEVDGRYEAFVEETKEDRDEAQDVRLDMGSQLADVTGTFLFALDTVVQPGTPLQFIAGVTFTAEGAGGTLAMELQPLALDKDSLTEPRTMVGDPIVVPPITVDEAGSFMIESLGILNVTGEANPITGGDIKADVSLAGGIQSEDIFCGTADGEVFEPLMLLLGGSTFAAQRIEATDPASLPTDILLRCPEGGGSDGGGSDGGGSDGGSGGDSGSGG